MRILIAEDDQMIGESLQKALCKSGYAVDWVQDGQEVIDCVETHDYSLLVLDLGLPNKDGHEILLSLRKQGSDIPILILTARDAVSDRVLGLDSGADEYMLKPFSLEELEARIRLLMRRRSDSKSGIITVDDFTLNTSAHEFFYKNVSYFLTAKEFALMETLMRSPNSVLSRAQLEESVYGWNQEVESNSIEVHIHQIRKKIGEKIIHNIRGVGYSIGRKS